MRREKGSLQLGMHAEDIIKRFGIQLRFEDDIWVAAFGFAGPDIVAQGKTLYPALENFKLQVYVENGDMEVEFVEQG